MRFDKIVANASPLIVLNKAGLLSKAAHVAKTWIVPQVVFEEVTAKPDVPADSIHALPNITTVAVEPEACILGWDLGRGESAVLSYALTQNHLPVCIDDRAAWRCAQTFALPITGTIGLLLRAKRMGYIASIKESISRLQDAGMWLSSAFVADLLHRENE
jgi:predicted nucleic acid-binding protein